VKSLQNRLTFYATTITNHNIVNSLASRNPIKRPGNFNAGIGKGGASTTDPRRTDNVLS
jgi:hypothetical protein